MARFTPEQQDSLRQAATRIVDGGAATDGGVSGDAAWSMTIAQAAGFVVRDADGREL